MLAILEDAAILCGEEWSLRGGLAGSGPARTAKKPSPLGNAVAAESPPGPRRPSFPWEWLFPRVSGVFKGKTNSTERLWESVKFIGDADLKPGVIDAYSNYQNEEEEYLKCQGHAGWLPGSAARVGRATIHSLRSTQGTGVSCCVALWLQGPLLESPHAQGTSLHAVAVVPKPQPQHTAL